MANPHAGSRLTLASIEIVNLSPRSRFFSPRNGIESRTQRQSVAKKNGHSAVAVDKFVLVRKARISFLLLLL